MKKGIAIVTLILATGIAAQAKDKEVFYQNGRLTQMQSVNCGFTEKSGKTFMGELVGTDNANIKNKELLCQEYTLKTDKVLYHIRPKDEKHPTLLPVGEDAKFRLKKDRMILTVPEIGAKEAEYFVISMSQVQPDAPKPDTAKMDVPGSK